MDEAAAYLTSNGEYVVVNTDYRRLSNQNNTITINEIIEDALGATLWVKSNIAKYKGDAKKVIVTGDSAGGHLAASVIFFSQSLSSNGFNNEPKGYNPTWLPNGNTAEDIQNKDELAVQAAIINYGVLDLYAMSLGNFETQDNQFWSLTNKKPRGLFGKEVSVNLNPDYYKKVSPFYNIPNASERVLPPMLFTVGEMDTLTTPESIKTFIDRLNEAGHDNHSYWEYKGKPHAFLDSGSNKTLNTNFEKDAPPALDKM